MKKFTRHLSLILAVLLLVQMLPLQSGAAGAEALTFALDGNGYSVTACDPAATGALTIPAVYEGKPVTGIHTYAFANCTGLTDITIPQSVTYIGGGAFSECNALTNVYYAGTRNQWDAITMDGGNEALLNATLYCMAGYDFAYEIQDNQVTITGGNTSIAGQVVIPAVIEGYPVVSIGSYAFANCTGLTGVTMADSVTQIGVGAFTHCIGLTELVLGSGVTRIDSVAFESCTGLRNVTIPKSVTAIGGGAFSNCNGIENVYYTGSQGQWELIAIDGGNDVLLNAALHCRDENSLSYEITNGGVTITGCRTSVIGELEIPAVIDGYVVTAIGDSAFYNCTGLTGITIPAGVTEMDIRAFGGCHNLMQIRVDAGNQTYSSDEMGVVYNKARTELILAPKGIRGSYVIPGGVTSIGTAAFFQCTGLTEIMLGSGVTKIEDYAFENCTGLTGVTVPKSVTAIGGGAFSNCTAIENVYYTGSKGQWNSIVIDSGNEALLRAALHCEDKNPLIYKITNGQVTILGCDASVTGVLEIPVAMEGYPVTAIGDSAFANCTGLTGVVIPEGVTEMGSRVFEGCTALATASIPGSITAVGEGIFSGCSALREVTLNEGITKIFFGMFAYCTGITQITIPDSVTVIEDYAFENCTGLTDITIPYGVSKIGSCAFTSCTSLTGITIPASVTDLDIWAFNGCDSLTGIWVDADNSVYSSDAQGVVYNPSKTLLILAPKGIRGSFSIPQGVREIGNYAFSDCVSLTQITIPTSVTRISDSAFFDCFGLETVYYSGSRQQWDAVAVEEKNGPLLSAVLRCAKMFSYSVKGGQATITGCDTSVTGVLEIPAVIDGYPVTALGASAFSSCTGLTGVTIPAGITDIHVRAFDGCSSLVVFFVDRANPAYCGDAQGVLYNKAKTELVLVPQGMRSGVVIPDGVTQIGSYAFCGCAHISEIKIPESVVYIQEGAFQGCAGLQDVHYAGTQQQFSAIILEENNEALLEAALHSKVEYPFTYRIEDGQVTIDICEETASGVLEIPAFIDGYPVTVIGNSAFYNCTGLTEIILPNTLTNIDSWAFDTCEGLTRITIPGSVSYIGMGAFICCTGLEEVVIESGVQTIGLYAFESCTALKTVTIPESVTSIEEGAFYDCGALEDVYYAGTQQQWGNIATDIDNEYLQNATLHCKVEYPFAYEVQDGQIEITACDTTVTGELEIPASIDGYPVTRISGFAFRGCTGLTGITIPASMTYIGVRAFDGCYNLTKFQVDVANSVYSGDETGVLYNKAKTQLILAPRGITGDFTIPGSVTEIGDFAFRDCVKLTGIVIPDSVTAVGLAAFNACSGLTYAQLGNGLTSIGNDAFSDCTSLAEIHIPESVTHIWEVAFQNCPALQDVHYAGTQQQWAAIIIESGNDSLLNATVHCKLFEELENGTLLLLNDTALQELTVEADRILDLNGHILTVQRLASFGQIVDSIGGGGLMVSEIEMSGNDWLPIRDSEGCYRFYEYRVTNLGTRGDADGISFGFTLDFADMEVYRALLQSEDVQITVSMSWNGETKTFAFSKELVARYVQLLAKYPMLRPYLRLSVTGLDSLLPGTQLTVTPAVTAVGGKLHNIGAGMTYTA